MTDEEMMRLAELLNQTTSTAHEAVLSIYERGRVDERDRILTLISQAGGYKTRYGGLVYKQELINAINENISND